MLQHITTRGKTYPLNFGIRTIASVADNLGLTIDKLVKTFNMPDLAFGELIKMVLCVTSVAMTEGARKSGTPHRYTDDDVADLIDDDGALLPVLIQLFRSSMSGGDPVFPTATGVTPGSPGKSPAAKPRKKK